MILLVLACGGLETVAAQTEGPVRHRHDVDSGTFGGLAVHWTPDTAAGGGIVLGTFVLRMPGMQVPRTRGGHYAWGEYGAFMGLGLSASLDPGAPRAEAGTHLWAALGMQGTIRSRWLTRALGTGNCRMGVEVGGAVGTMNLANSSVGGEIAAVVGAPIVCELSADVTLAVVPQGGIAAATTFGYGADLHGYGNIQAGTRIDLASGDLRWLSLEYLARFVPASLHSARENGYVGHHILLVYQHASERPTLSNPRPMRVVVFAVGSDYRSPWSQPVDGGSIWQFLLGGGVRFM